MIETNETGQKQIEHLLKNHDDPVFNDWERSFIRDLQSRRYSNMTKHQKAVITRLIGWLEGK